MVLNDKTSQGSCKCLSLYLWLGGFDISRLPDLACSAKLFCHLSKQPIQKGLHNSSLASRHHSKISHFVRSLRCFLKGVLVFGCEHFTISMSAVDQCRGLPCSRHSEATSACPHEILDLQKCKPQTPLLPDSRSFLFNGI